MRITDLLDKRSISLDGAPKNKQEALDMAIDLMKGSDKINDQEAYRKQVYKREEEEQPELVWELQFLMVSAML